MAGRYVALGDSFTEGVGDPDPNLPNGVRGWADRVAKQLGKADPHWQYANLAVRSKRLHHVIKEQLEPALALKPTLVSLYAGGNDILEFRQDMGRLMADYEELVAALTGSGAQLLLFTGYDVQVHPMLEPMRRRNWLYNDAVRGLAAKYGATLLDYWTWDAYHDRRMWGSDKLHMSRAGHRYMAAQVLNILDVEHSLKIKAFGPWERGDRRMWLRQEQQWLSEWVLPMFARKFRGVTLGDDLPPRWPELIYPAEGLKKLARARLVRPARA